MHYGLETLSYPSPQLWSLLPENIKNVEPLEILKEKVNVTIDHGDYVNLFAAYWISLIISAVICNVP